MVSTAKSLVNLNPQKELFDTAGPAGAGSSMLHSTQSFSFGVMRN